MSLSLGVAVFPGANDWHLICVDRYEHFPLVINRRPFQVGAHVDGFRNVDAQPYIVRFNVEDFIVIFGDGS